MSMFEKMFKSSSAKKEGEKGVLRKILSPAETAIKIGAFAAAVGGPMQALAEGEKNNPENSPNRVEDARLALGKIIPFVEKNDNSLTHTFANTNVKTFETSDGRKIVSATDKTFVILSIDDGGYTYLDNGSDGTLDRIIINKEESAENRSLVKNDFYMFSSMDQLFEEVSVIADLKPEKIKVISFDLDKMEITFVSAEDGTTGKLEGEEARKVIERFQGSYSDKLLKMAADQGK